MKLSRLKTIIVTGCFSLLLTGCLGLNIKPIDLEVNGNQLIMEGVVYTDSPTRLKAVIDANPQIDTLVLRTVAGSADDHSNLKMARYVRKLGLTTIVPKNGLVASGGTDLFLAGKQRIIESGACIGVHSWGGHGVESGASVPRTDPIHQMYLSYYNAMGIPQDFYWFTLEKAPVDDMHWMNAKEIQQFVMTTQAMDNSVLNETAKQRYQRCTTKVDSFMATVF